MLWQTLRIVLAALCLPWALVVLGALISAAGYVQEPEMLRAMGQAFEAVGVMRHTGKPVIAMIHLSNAENLNLGYPYATVVKRKEVSFNPAAVQKALPQADREFWTYGGESFVEVRVLDANADGQLDVLFQYDYDTLVEPTAHISYLYTVTDNTPVPLLAVRGEIGPLEPVRLKDGTYAFVNQRTLWQNKAYVWKGGRYRLLDFDAREKRRQMRRHVVGPPLGFVLWAWLISLVPAGWLLLTWWMDVWHRVHQGQRLSIWNGYAPLLWLWAIGFAIVAWRIIYPRLYHPGYMLTLVLFFPSWLAGLGAALTQTVLAVRYNRGRGDGDGNRSDKTGGALPGVGW